MAKTELGYQVLQEKGHFAEFSDFIRQHGLESVDHDLIMKLKSVLWAVVSYYSPDDIHVTSNTCDRGTSEQQRAALRCSRTKKSFPKSSRLQRSHWCSLYEGKWCKFMAS